MPARTPSTPAAALGALQDPTVGKREEQVFLGRDYGELGAYLKKTRGLPSVEIRTPYRSTWLDNSKAKFLLGWRPRYDLARMTELVKTSCEGLPNVDVRLFAPNAIAPHSA